MCSKKHTRWKIVGLILALRKPQRILFFDGSPLKIRHKLKDDLVGFTFFSKIKFANNFLLASISFLTHFFPSIDFVVSSSYVDSIYLSLLSGNSMKAKGKLNEEFFFSDSVDIMVLTPEH